MVALIDFDSILYKSIYFCLDRKNDNGEFIRTTISFCRELLSNHTKEQAKSLFMQEVYNEGINRCENEILKMQNYLQSIFLEEIKSWELYITSCTKPFRAEVSREYKKKRKRNNYVWMLREHYKFNDAFFSDTHEADDLIFDRAKELGNGNFIVVSIDKDLKQIGGYYWSYQKEPEKDLQGNYCLNEHGNKMYNYKYNSVDYITNKEANIFFWMQMLMGDSVDGVAGLKRVGIKTAEKILKNSLCPWVTVAREYIKRNQKEDFYTNYKLLKLGNGKLECY